MFRRIVLCGVLALCGTASAAPTKEAIEKLGGKVTLTKDEITQLSIDVGSFTEVEYRTIGQITSLKKLSLNGKTINDANLPLLAGLENLEELSTNLTQLTDDGYKHFAQFKKLRSLSLFHPSFGVATFTGSGLAHLKNLPNLERLTYAGASTGDGAIEAIGQITQLKDFSTWHTYQTQAGNKALLNLKNLRSLRVGQRLPKGPGKPPLSLDASTLPLLAQIKTLQKLEIFEARLTAADFGVLKDLPELKSLTIHTTDMAAADVEALKKALPSVKVDFKPMTDEEREATLVKKMRV